MDVRNQLLVLLGLGRLSSDAPPLCRVVLASSPRALAATKVMRSLDYSILQCATIYLHFHICCRCRTRWRRYAYRCKETSFNWW